MDERHHWLAFDLGVAVRHRDRRFFVAARQKLGHFVVAVINERLMQRFVRRARIGGQILDIQGLEDVHHVIGARMLDHAGGLGRTCACFARQRHLRGLRGRSVDAAILGRRLAVALRLLGVRDLRFRHQRRRAGRGAF